jgi:hypothetical protein
MRKFERLVYLYGKDRAIELLLEHYPMPRHPPACTLSQHLDVTRDWNKWVRKIERAAIGFKVFRLGTNIELFQSSKELRDQGLDLLAGELGDSTENDDVLLEMVKEAIAFRIEQTK